ncbi:Mitogen-activated protein kinase kinase kinase NPK1 [Rhynchospora pubera]|uniref:Mitogen-activated protein kinase kinase kinase NPK1 n=1 Tax=Rhynchospora pubera TaxID=906938 RepID=A0AAV8BRY6_9POAL|nr:Mitogen-activated protein kinase kinase kinase NPK1 [Rhynchospora pubera]
MRFDVRNGDYGQYRRDVLDELNQVCHIHRQIPVVGPKQNTWNWFFLEVTCGEFAIVLGICADTLYQYTWRKGGPQGNFTWFVTKGESVHGLPGDTQEQPFSGNYTEIGDPHEVFVTRENLEHSVRVLYSNNNTEEVKIAFLRLVVTFCAGVRIKSIYKKIYNSLHRGVIKYLSPDDTDREKKWSLASDYYLKGDDTTRVRGYGIMNDETAREHLSTSASGKTIHVQTRKILMDFEVLIGTSNASKEKAQAHIRELEEEVKLLKNLSHPNIVRYLGTVREENTLNILLESVPGRCISSLLSKFGSFPEPGANILVDNKGCIKLADFGASKQVAKLATMTAAKSMKGTQYWMAPEIIVQSGHSFSVDIWSVGCTVIEMATGKPPWSGHYQEVAALFHVGTRKSHPPIPEHLSFEAKDFLLKCLQEYDLEPSLRPTASDLLQESYNHVFGANKTQTCNFAKIMESDKVSPARPVWEISNDDDGMCRLDDGDDFPVIGLSFNPMLEPLEEWPCKFDISPEQRTLSSQHLVDIIADHDDITCTPKGDYCDANEFSFPSDTSYEDDDGVSEFKIRAFLDEKALKKLQTPLYEGFHTSMNASNAQVISSVCKENKNNNCNNITINASKLSPMIPRKISSAAFPTLRLSGSSRNTSPGGSFIRRITSAQRNEWVPPEHHSDNQEPLSQR